MTEKHPKEMSRDTQRSKDRDPQRKESKPEKKPPLFVVKENCMLSMIEEYIWFI